MHTKNVAEWRDIGVKIQGDAVRDVMAAFADTLSSQNQKLPESIVLPAFSGDEVSGSLRAGWLPPRPATTT